jgi:tetratricopeptide (TPR) repeat protein
VAVGALRDHDSREQPADALIERATALALRQLRQDLAVSLDAAVRLGTALMRNGDEQGAREALEDALATAERLGFARERSQSLLALAELALSEGDAGRARGSVEAASELAHDAGDELQVGAVHLLTARIHAHAGELGRATAEFDRAVAIFERSVSTDRLAEAHAAFAEALEQRGRVREALEHWKRAATVLRPNLPGAEDRGEPAVSPVRARRRARRPV